MAKVYLLMIYRVKTTSGKEGEGHTAIKKEEN